MCNGKVPLSRARNRGVPERCVYVSALTRLVTYSKGAEPCCTFAVREMQCHVGLGLLRNGRVMSVTGLRHDVLELRRNALAWR